MIGGDGGSKDSSLQELPVVPMSEETGEVVERLLQLCYPIKQPVWESLTELQPVLVAAVKYQFEALVGSLRKELVCTGHLQSESLRVFAVACRLRLADEARLAARHTLAQLLGDKPATPEMQYISALPLHRLIEYRHRCSYAARYLTLSPGTEWIPTDEAWIWIQCGGKCPRKHSKRCGLSVARWWIEYMKDACIALEKRPCGASVTAQSTLKASLRKASKCKICKSKAPEDLQRFSQLLGVKIEEAIDEVNNSY
ncbi:hypothetical protein GLOTRDRAFT_39749 [Gloeophyllum trabeum ATCC 11539]|uniref:BTB domain-containing protein n=1 Tax=Gloeophyllum trabeum (strain ATCC 11539 / FP-39264 / Madison 617) TaxID=670483 RepID=S7Q7Z4_GLOTA|nr:uncharacterized protein GLOTRDRAFT_39749 [Gloeophyllum trabeum ATCC 11539]EPQ56106.1 hypothetical protein GLOTRDRAFT_39749 [Gloeophyllum trabeum ATCC 11539]